MDDGRGYSTTGQPFMLDDTILFPAGCDYHELVAFVPKGTGELADAQIRWRKRGAPSMSSSLLVGNQIYSAGDRGILSIMNASTGPVGNDLLVRTTDELIRITAAE